VQKSDFIQSLKVAWRPHCHSSTTMEPQSRRKRVRPKNAWNRDLV